VQEGKHPSENYNLPAAEPLCAESERVLTLSIEQRIDDLRPRFTERIHRFLRDNYELPLTPANLAHLERVGFRKALVALETSSGLAEEFPQFLAKSLQSSLGKLGEDSPVEHSEREVATRRFALPNQNASREAIQFTPDDQAAVVTVLSAIRSTVRGSPPSCQNPRRPGEIVYRSRRFDRTFGKRHT
jgi:hypothetical protein